MMPMMKKGAVVIAALVLLLTSCGEGTVTERQHVEEAVLLSYTTLLDGRYADYVSLLAGASKRSADYNEQLAANAAMFIEEQQRLHTNIVDVRVADVKIARDGAKAEAYVVLCYADSTNEEIVVPVLKEQGTWKVR